MTAIIPTRQGKRQSLDLLRQCLNTFVFPHLAKADIDRILTHLAWMDRQPETLFVKAHFDTFPGVKSTRLTLDFNFMQNPATEEK